MGKKFIITANLIVLFFFIVALLLSIAGTDSVQAAGISNPLSSTSLVDFLSKALGQLVKILIPFIVVFFVVIGLMFISARGKPEKLETAKKALLGGVIGTIGMSSDQTGSWPKDLRRSAKLKTSSSQGQTCLMTRFDLKR